MPLLNIIGIVCIVSASIGAKIHVKKTGIDPNRTIIEQREDYAVNVLEKRERGESVKIKIKEMKEPQFIK